MPRGPNHRPDKGFTRELAMAPKPVAQGKKNFEWNKPVVKPEPTQGMATPHRLENNRAVKAPAPSFARETIQHRDSKKRGP